MKTFLLVVDLLLASAIVLIVLIQRGDSGGALGIGGGGGGGMFSARGKANFLTRTTATLAALFFATSLALAYISKQERPASLIESIEQEELLEGSETPQKDVPLAQ